MPLELQQSIAASIELDSFQLSYRPGDVIAGKVVRIQLEQPGDVTVTLQFWARVKTYTTERRGNNNTTHHYRGESSLFNIAKTLYQGEASVGKNVWPFTLTIPDTHLPPRPAPGNSLPPSHYVRDEYHNGRHRVYLYVKYVVEAEIRDTSRRGNSGLATLPLNIRNPSSLTPIQDNAVLAMATEERIKTLHLLPEYANESLSFRQHMASVFKRSAVPQYNVAIVVEFPSVIQLEHPSPLPFRIRGIVRNGENKTTSSVAEKPPEIHLVSGAVYLRSATNTEGLESTSFDFYGKLSNYVEGCWNHHPLIMRTDFMDFDGKQLAVPMEHQQGKEAAIDIGKNLNLGLSTRGVQESGKFLPFAVPLYPSFHSQHVQHIHELKWELVFACAGKKFEIGGKHPVRVMGPSEEREQQILGIIGEEGIKAALTAWAHGNVHSPTLALGMP
ncbi:uncharacterized protein PG998_007586 [Apiospora kogelbergensis]|uniref:Arrestin-like N-terminal domain-containing protein n=1 Tax=Apiospora kogelbergensis TaxID=1337665 RepID=A0AAW0QSZ6_9PEZI